MLDIDIGDNDVPNVPDAPVDQARKGDGLNDIPSDPSLVREVSEQDSDSSGTPVPLVAGSVPKTMSQASQLLNPTGSAPAGDAQVKEAQSTPHSLARPTCGVQFSAHDTLPSLPYAASPSAIVSPSDFALEEHSLLLTSGEAASVLSHEQGSEVDKNPQASLALGLVPMAELPRPMTASSVTSDGLSILRARTPHRSSTSALVQSVESSGTNTVDSPSYVHISRPPANRLPELQHSFDDVEPGRQESSMRPTISQATVMRAKQLAAQFWFAIFFGLFTLASGLSLIHAVPTGCRLATAAFATASWGGMTTMLFEAWAFFQSVHSKAAWIVFSMIVGCIMAWLIARVDPESAEIP